MMPRDASLWTASDRCCCSSLVTPKWKPLILFSEIDVLIFLLISFLIVLNLDCNYTAPISLALNGIAIHIWLIITKFRNRFMRIFFIASTISAGITSEAKQRYPLNLNFLSEFYIIMLQEGEEGGILNNRRRLYSKKCCPKQYKFKLECYINRHLSSTLEIANFTEKQTI